MNGSLCLFVMWGPADCARVSCQAGMMAGLTEAVLIVTPFEVVKTRLQQQEGSKNLKYRVRLLLVFTLLTALHQR